MADQYKTPRPVHDGRAMMRLADDVWLEWAPGNPSYGGVLHARYHAAVAICQQLGFAASPHYRKGEGQDLPVVYLTRAKASKLPDAVRKLKIAGCGS